VFETSTFLSLFRGRVNRDRQWQRKAWQTKETITVHNTMTTTTTTTTIVSDAPPTLGLPFKEEYCCFHHC
jgi:hypothetical protein